MSLSIVIANDCPLNETIPHFENDMFAVTDKFIKEHSSFNEELVIVNGRWANKIVTMIDLDHRRKALDEFNGFAKQHITSFPKPDGFSCCLIDFMDDENIYAEADIKKCYSLLVNAFLDWMKENERVAVMVPHFYQGERIPHVHILYQRDMDKHNEFQTYLLNNI